MCSDLSSTAACFSFIVCLLTIKFNIRSCKSCVCVLCVYAWACVCVGGRWGWGWLFGQACGGVFIWRHPHVFYKSVDVQTSKPKGAERRIFSCAHLTGDRARSETSPSQPYCHSTPPTPPPPPPSQPPPSLPQHPGLTPLIDNAGVANQSAPVNSYWSAVVSQCFY